MKQKLLVSACLLGQAVRYDGAAKRCDHALLARWVAEGRVLPLCPELLGGLPVPRPPAEIGNGAGGAAVLAGSAQVVDVTGQLVSGAFLAGARRTLALAQAEGVRVAVLKEGSPSCGSARIRDGSFGGLSVAGAGVTAALLRQAGLQVFSEDQLAEAQACLDALDVQQGCRSD